MARKILLADDSVTAQNMGRRILSDAGYEVTTVNNGSAALKKIAESLPELIVLDVYMPGYSGLEVCQRLKETRETARIPVLLTVGKLEPFKPEDARRARADAFIVKPFEASELLTALTKLEDKIVPQPTGKSGQFAKVWAELEKSDDGKSEKFGDSETGWKDRLSIPTGSKKKEDHQEEEELSAKSGKGKKDKGKEKKKDEELKPLEVKPPVDAVSAAGVPADITPEEVAAIAAAAAAFEEKNQPAEFSVKKSEIPEDTATSGSALKPETAGSEPVEAKAQESEAAKETPSAEVAKTVEVQAESRTSEPTPSAATDAVADAKAAPSEAAQTASAPVADKPSEAVEASSKPVPEPTKPTGPRWMATEVSLPPTETGVNLEQEMQKATAVLQAATAMVDLSAMASAEPAAAPVVTEAPADTETKSEAKPDAETKDVPANKVEEPQTVDATPEPERPQEPAAVATPEAEPEVVTAVAAAASAGTAAQESKSEPVTTSSPSSNETPAPETKANESELAAAWAQWKQIRETVVGSQLTSQIADVAAAELKNAEPASAPAEDEAHPEKPGNPTAIASIVDSVLAELKPKLVEEIAKKLGDEKGKKKKS